MRDLTKLSPEDQDHTDHSATMMLRLRVNYRMDTPTEADAILLNAALHIEGRHAEAAACRQPLPAIVNLDTLED